MLLPCSFLASPYSLPRSLQEQRRRLPYHPSCRYHFAALSPFTSDFDTRFTPTPCGSMSTLDSSAPANSAANAGSNGNLPAIQYVQQHPPSDLAGYHPQQAQMGHMPPHGPPPAPPPPSQHALQQPPGAYLPGPGAYMSPNTHYSPQPAPYDSYGPPPPPQHAGPYGMPHFTHASHSPSPYAHHFQPEYHHDPFQYSASFRNYVTDPSGQSGPPGMKPRVTTTLWEDEGTLCFQVEAKGICVARREGESISREAPSDGFVMLSISWTFMLIFRRQQHDQWDETAKCGWYEPGETGWDS